MGQKAVLVVHKDIWILHIRRGVSRPVEETEVRSAAKASKPVLNAFFISPYLSFRHRGEILKGVIYTTLFPSIKFKRGLSERENRFCRPDLRSMRIVGFGAGDYIR